MVVCRKLHQGEPGGPVVLSVRNVTSKVLFHDGIEPFCLSIGFWVVCRGEFGGDLEALTQVFPELRDELCAPITDDGVGEPMEFEDVPQKHVGDVHGRGYGSARNQVSHF